MTLVAPKRGRLPLRRDQSCVGLTTGPSFSGQTKRQNMGNHARLGAQRLPAPLFRAKPTGKKRENARFGLSGQSKRRKNGQMERGVGRKDKKKISLKLGWSFQAPASPAVRQPTCPESCGLQSTTRPFGGRCFLREATSFLCFFVWGPFKTTKTRGANSKRKGVSFCGLALKPPNKG